MVITERQEAILSYLIGLGPVGTPVSYRRKHILQDLRITPVQDSRFHRDLEHLMHLGAVRLVSGATGCLETTVCVLHRGEGFTVVPNNDRTDWWLSPRYARLEDFERVRREQRARQELGRKSSYVPKPVPEPKAKQTIPYAGKEAAL